MRLFPVTLALVLSIAGTVAAAQDPLPSWNDTASKKAIMTFVGRVTTSATNDFVAPEDRIAVFDNDGTLWCEQPMYTQLAFAMDRVRSTADAHPQWKETEPFKSVLAGDLDAVAATGVKGMLEITLATHGGLTTEQFHDAVLVWLRAARHPRFERPYTDLVYQPMLEVLEYLRTNQFKTYIVSGGGIEFVRPWAPGVYAIPPEQVIGSRGEERFEFDGNRSVLMKEPKIAFVNDGPNKPVGINTHIGRRPIMAFGNSDGDMQMLQYTTAGPGARFGLIVHHTDADREYAYDRQSRVGKLDKALEDAPHRGWTVVDMKSDWKTVFPPRK